ncbi:MAG: class I SAM-dependent methyltransferase [Sphingobacteriaceae bacterium]|nr:MAG: class I SAM-dependent methyltransferase [Sphingobacteriaceae bacterium]
MENGEKENVYKVYNKIATWFFKTRPSTLIEKSYLDDLVSQIPLNATVLDLGCGSGNPILKYLISRKLNVIGVDASSEMLKIAQTNFPTIEFVLQDMRLLNLSKKFDAIIAWHSFFHLPAIDQPAMFQRFKEHLNPDGVLLFTSGTENGEAWGMNGGENLFHASLANEEYKSLLKKHHFEILNYKANDPDCGFATVWMAKYNSDNAY